MADIHGVHHWLKVCLKGCCKAVSRLQSGQGIGAAALLGWLPLILPLCAAKG